MYFKREDVQNIVSRAGEIQKKIQSGVEQYAAIRNLFSAGRSDKDFQQTFCRFYRVRGKIDRDEIFRILNDKNKEDLSYEDILTRLSLGGKVVNVSFASKILHTLDNSNPIYDSVIARFFHVYRKEKKYQDRFREATEIFAALKAFYENKNKNELMKLSKSFEDIFPNTGFSDEKKIDFMIWGSGR